MPINAWNLEFLNHNSQRSYPLVDSATKTDTTGSFVIPNDFLVGMDIPVSPAMNMETGRFFIYQIGLFASGVQLIVAYDTGTEIVNVASALVPFTNFKRNSVFALAGIDPFDDIVGKVVIGRLDTIQTQPAGLFTFALEDSQIEPQAVRPMIRGITAFKIANAAGTVSERLYGDVELVAGSNMSLNVVVDATQTKIIFNALSGAGTIDPCVCEGEAELVPCIRSINGIYPTPDGNFTFTGDSCLQFEGITNGLKVTDNCCTPCCGCEELETITRDLERFNSQRSALELFVNNLAAETARFNTTVLGARLGDRKCLVCE